MAVQNDPLQISPYTSTVPLVQLPPEVVGGVRPSAPLEGQFGKKGTGALAIGDSIFKGFMAGHQQKEQRKYALAQANVAAADAAEHGAYEKYQEVLRQAGGKEDESTKAAYDAYMNVFQQSKAVKAALVMPEKGQKGKKKGGDSDPMRSPDDKKGGGGFGAGIKDFFAANPHIIPQIALMTMTPKPQGLSAETKASVLDEKEKALKFQSSEELENNKKTYQAGYAKYASLSAEEGAKLPPEDKKGYDAWVGAKAALTPMRQGGSMYTYKLRDGSLQKMYPEDAAASGAELYVAGQDLKPGTRGFYLQQIAREIGKPVNDLTPQEIEEADRREKVATSLGGSTTSTSTVDPQGNRSTTTNRTVAPGGNMPQPPPTRQGSFPAPPTAQSSSQQGVTPPPSAAAPQKSAGGMAQPPTTGKGTKSFAPKKKEEGDTQYTARITFEAQKEQSEGYNKAEQKFSDTQTKAADKRNKALTAATKAEDQAATDRANAEYEAEIARSKADLLKAKDAVKQKYDARVKQIGGTPGSENKQQAHGVTPPPQAAATPPPGATGRVKDQHGNIIGWAVNGQFVPIGKQ